MIISLIDNGPHPLLEPQLLQRLSPLLCPSQCHQYKPMGEILLPFTYLLDMFLQSYKLLPHSDLSCSWLLTFKALPIVLSFTLSHSPASSLHAHPSSHSHIPHTYLHTHSYPTPTHTLFPGPLHIPHLHLYSTLNPPTYHTLNITS